MTCNDCIHKEACTFSSVIDTANHCRHYEDKSHFVELPCKNGMKRISRKKLEQFGIKHFVPKKGFAKYAIDTLPDGESLRIFYKFNFLAKVITIFLFPITVLIVGIGNFSVIKDDFRKVWNIEIEWCPADVILSGSGKLYNSLSAWYWSK